MKEKGFHIAKISNFLVFIILETAAILLVSNYDIVKDWGFVQSLSRPTTAISKGILSIGDYFSLRKVNNRLAEENATLRNDNEMLLNIVSNYAENTISIRHQSNFTYIPAKVISNNTDKLNNYIIIDKGSSDSLEAGMGIVTERGIIGYIVSTGQHYSKVSSILNVDNTFSAELERTGTFGTVKWEGLSAHKVTLGEIPVHTVIEKGDTVISSGYSLIYPPLIPIGTVEDKELRDGTHYEVSVRLFENFNRLKYVYIVKRNDIDELKAVKAGGNKK